MKTMKIKIALFVLAALIFTSCKKKDDTDNTPVTGKIAISFEHFINDQPAVVNDYSYTNAAGNVYSFFLVRYFISDVELYKSDGTTLKIDDWTDHFYVDTDIPHTLLWNVYDEISSGYFDSLSFRFGFSDAKNQSFMFVNQPESNMVWPEELGGGYHYLQLEGKWIDPNGIKIGYAFHLGRGQHYDGSGNPIPPFIDNSFRVSLPNSAFSVKAGETTNIVLRMNIENWFEEPHIYDHNQWGGDIMQQQPAMLLAKENGWNVFSFHLNNN